MAEREFNIKCEPEAQMADGRDENTQFMEGLIRASLCSNCKHLGDCVHLLKASCPIIECELHESGMTSKPRLALVQKKIESDSKEEFSVDEILGLCCNCENLGLCTLPKHTGGVWYCEEYR